MIRLRPYKDSDAREILSWCNNEIDFYKWTAGVLGKYPITAEDFNKVKELMPFTAFDENGIVGFFTLRYLGDSLDELRFGFVIVDPKLRNKGYGKEMLQKGLKYVFDIYGARKASLGVFENNQPAYYCYKAVGFRNVQLVEDEIYHVLNEEWHCKELEIMQANTNELFSERLIIRPLRELDYPEFERTLNEAQKSCFEDGGRGFLNWLIAQYNSMDIVNGLISFGMFQKTDGKLVGTIGAGEHDDLHETEVFYYLLPEYRGLGFATEATKIVTKWALNNYDIPYIIGTAEVDNIKSQQVLERCEYQLIDTKHLLVHVENRQSDYKYYRYYV